MVSVDLLKVVSAGPVVGGFLSSHQAGTGHHRQAVEGGGRRWKEVVGSGGDEDEQGGGGCGAGGTAWPLTTAPATWHTAHGCGALGSEVEPKEAAPHCGWEGAGHRVNTDTCSPQHLAR